MPAAFAEVQPIKWRTNDSDGKTAARTAATNLLGSFRACYDRAPCAPFETKLSHVHAPSAVQIDKDPMPALFQEFRLKDVVLRNRIAVSPMCQYSSNDGLPNDWHLVHLGSRAVGGAGLVIVEATAVSPEGRISPRDSGIWSDAHIEPFARITRFLKEHHAVPGLQIAHAGRKASANRPWEGDNHLQPQEGAWPIIGPSAVPFGANLPVAPEK
jgi:hypothetical protein